MSVLLKPQYNLFDSNFEENIVEHKQFAFENSRIELGRSGRFSFAWTDCSDFISRIKDRLIHDEQFLFNYQKFERSHFGFLNKQIWFKSNLGVETSKHSDFVHRYFLNEKSYNEIPKKFMISFFSSQGPFIEVNAHELLGEKYILHAVQWLLLNEKIKSRDFRINIKGESQSYLDGRPMLERLKIKSIGVNGIHAFLSIQNKESIKAASTLSFDLDSSLMEHSTSSSITEFVQLIDCYSSELFYTQDNHFNCSILVEEMKFRHNPITPQKIDLFIPYEKLRSSKVGHGSIFQSRMTELKRLFESLA